MRFLLLLFRDRDYTNIRALMDSQTSHFVQCSFKWYVCTTVINLQRELYNYNLILQFIPTTIWTHLAFSTYLKFNTKGEPAVKSQRLCCSGDLTRYNSTSQHSSVLSLAGRSKHNHCSTRTALVHIQQISLSTISEGLTCRTWHHTVLIFFPLGQEDHGKALATTTGLGTIAAAACLFNKCFHTVEKQNEERCRGGTNRTRPAGRMGDRHCCAGSICPLGPGLISTSFCLFRGSRSSSEVWTPDTGTEGRNLYTTIRPAAVVEDKSKWYIQFPLRAYPCYMMIIHWVAWIELNLNFTEKLEKLF